MAFLNNFGKYHIFLITISLIFTLQITMVLTPSNQITLTNNESSSVGFDAQVPRESESYVYYEDTEGSAYGVFVRGDYAYVADEFSGLAVIDISNPINPGTPIYVETQGRAYDVCVSGNYAYVADSDLAIIDISDPTNPGDPVYEFIMGNAYDVCVSGNYAYFSISSGLVVIDISDPTNPGAPVYKDIIGYAHDVYVSGNYAYLALSSGLSIIDISDPTNPGVPVYKDAKEMSKSVFVSGNYAYVTDLNTGLAIINISNPINPGTPIYVDIKGSAQSVYVSGDYAYVADSDGLAVIDISDPTNLGAPIYESTNGSANDVYVSGDYVYVADRGDGLAIINKDDMLDLKITHFPSDFTVNIDYTEQRISWTATDPKPNTYTIDLQGSGIVVGPDSWTSGSEIVYNIPIGFSNNSYIYTVNFTNIYGDSITDSVTFIVKIEERWLPGVNFELILVISIITITSIVMVEKKIYRSKFEKTILKGRK